MKRDMGIIAAAIVLLAAFSLCGATFDPAQAWADLLHYIRIARYDLAKAYGQSLIDGNVDPVALFEWSARSPQDYQLLQRASQNMYDKELAQIADRLIALIEQGRQARRSDPQVISQEIERLLGPSERGNAIALQRLRDSGEYAVPFILDAMAEPTRRTYIDRLVQALANIGGAAVRPLCVAIRAADPAVRVEVVRALGRIGSSEVLPFLKYVAENDRVDEIRAVAAAGIRQVDPSASAQSAASLFYRLAMQYYQQPGSSGTVNMWFWDPNSQSLVRRPVDGRQFNDLMSMRCCEWTLRADASYADAVSLWAAAFMRAQSYGIPLPGYLPYADAGPLVHATATGPRYLQQVLALALKDGNKALAIDALEGLMANAGPRSILLPVGSVQPVVEALRWQDPQVRTMAAIAIANAGPRGPFNAAQIVVENLSAAIASVADPNAAPDPNKEGYAIRSLEAMLAIASRAEGTYDLLPSQQALITATQTGPASIRALACHVLAHIPTAQAQQALASQGLRAENDLDLRVTALEALALSAKNGGCLLEGQMVEGLLSLVRSNQTQPDLRLAAASALGSLDLPSTTVKDLILAGSVD